MTTKTKNILRWIALLPACAFSAGIMVAIINVLFASAGIDGYEGVSIISNAVMTYVILEVAFLVAPKKVLGISIIGGLLLMVNLLQFFTITSHPFIDPEDVVMSLISFLLIYVILMFYFIYRAVGEEKRPKTFSNEKK